MKRKLLSILLIGALSLSLASCASEETSENTQNTTLLVSEAAKLEYESYINSASAQFGYDVAYELSENPEYWNSDIGGRTSGSEAEHKAADYLEGVMIEMGLEDVQKVAADVDTWQQNGAKLTIDGKDYVVSSYASSGTSEDGITAEIVYLNQGTMWDYEGLDVEGKIVLIDINMRENWWITYPMLEAEFQGAAAIINASTGGYSQIADDALNNQDICAPISIPSVSIGVKDSLEIQEKIANGTTMATLVVDNIVEEGGTTYNVIGRIKGKSSENQIIVGAHYDMYFKGFQDDSIAIGLSLAMAKGMIDSGFVPENDIVFVMHGAEEWGSIGTQFDWTVGAWEMVNTVYPEWTDKTLAFINFELPAYAFGTSTSTASAPEMFSMIEYFTNTYELTPNPLEVFPDGVNTEGTATYTYSDDFSYYIAGIPSTVNGTVTADSVKAGSDFMVNYYHSNYDTYETYDEEVMKFNLDYYGALAMFIDSQPALYLDFTAQYDRILASINEEIMTNSGADIASYTAVLEELNTTATLMKEKVEQVNADYNTAVINNDTQAMDELWAEGKELTAQNLAAFKFAQDALLSLMYEKPIVPHEGPQINIELMQEIVVLLENGEGDVAADEYVWQVNNVFEWYAMYFSEEVIDIQNEMIWGEDNQDNLYWGTNKGFVKAEVEEATRSLMTKYGLENQDYTAEIEIYNEEIVNQAEILKDLADKEIEDMNTLIELLTLNN